MPTSLQNDLSLKMVLGEILKSSARRELCRQLPARIRFLTWPLLKCVAFCFLFILWLQGLDLCIEHTTDESLLLKPHSSQGLWLTSPNQSLTETCFLLSQKKKNCVLKTLVLILQVNMNLVISFKVFHHKPYCYQLCGFFSRCITRQIPPKDAMVLKIIDQPTIVNITENFW